MCWFVSQGRAWSIVGIEDKTLFLDPPSDKKEIDLSRAKWDSYCDHYAAVLEAQRKGWQNARLVSRSACPAVAN